LKTGDRWFGACDLLVPSPVPAEKRDEILSLSHHRTQLASLYS
jgi:hypothetical protein